VKAFLDGIAKRDKVLIQKQFLPEGGATIIGGGKLLQFRLSAFSEHMPEGTQTLEERIRDPLIRIDDNIAIIWAPYVFLVDGKITHCGTDVVSLVKLDGHWRIASAGNNARTTNCKKW
jgi:hypothetical protein